MRRRTFLASLATLVAAAGCTDAFKRLPPERHYYVVEAAPAVPVRSNGQAILPDTALKVRNLRISPRYENKELVYRVGDLSYESDYYNVFFTSPAANLTSEVRRGLETAAVFGHVLEAGSQIEARHFLEGAVHALYGDYRVRSAPKAVLEIQFLLVAETGTSANIVFQKDYRRQTPIESASPQALVKGFSVGLTDMLRELAEDLRTALARTPA